METQLVSFFEYLVGFYGHFGVCASFFWHLSTSEAPTLGSSLPKRQADLERALHPGPDKLFGLLDWRVGALLVPTVASQLGVIL